MCDATEGIKNVAQTIELWNVGSRRKLGVGWKGLGGDSQAKLMGQWAMWPCRWCEEEHTCQKVQITQTSSSASVVGLLEAQCLLGLEKC